jgi:hypothetical protein
MPDDSIPDMKPIRYDHCPELGFRADLPSPIAGTAVGWLGSTVPETGPLPSGAIEALRAAKAVCPTDTGDMGYHTCGICGAFEDRGEFIVETEDRTYVLPAMVLHYVEAHRYRPPQRFLDDLGAWANKSNR